MSSISEKEQNVLVSVCNVGRLEAAHIKVVLDAIDASEVVSTSSHLFTNAFFQLAANGIIGKDEAALLKAAVEAAAAGNPISDSGHTADMTRAACRKLSAIWPQATVEGLVTLIFT